jgi:outer membrane protein insertion porin family
MGISRKCKSIRLVSGSAAAGIDWLAEQILSLESALVMLRMRLLDLLLFSLAATAVAQQPFLGPQAAYEGETVTAVDLVANPHVDIAPFQALVEQKTGQPYSEKKVEASVAALEKSEKFGSVKVSVSPTPNGLRLSFILEPVYYIGIIEFPEAAKHFSYVRLLQVADLPDQDPFDKARIPEAQTALRYLFREGGYFQAQVRAETRLDDVNQLANVIFHVTLGPRARIGQVKLEGVSGEETARLMHAVDSLRARLNGGLLKPGQTYTRSRLRDAQKLIKRALAKQDYLASKVTENPPDYHPDSNRVDVSYRIEVGPVVIIKITGAKLSAVPFLSGREARKLIPIYSEGSIDRDLVTEGQQNLIDYFQEKGFFKVKVDTNFSSQPDRISLTYQIDKGRKHKVERISFQGNRHVSSRDLEAQIPIKKAHFWSHGRYSDKLVQTAAENIAAIYHNVGYEEVEVTPGVVEQESKIDVHFNIVEGEQTLVDTVAITGNKNIPQNQLLGAQGFELRPGAAFSPGKLVTDRNRISAAYLDRGYVNAEVKAVVTRHLEARHKVDIAYDVTENQQVRISQVLYLGQQHTRLSLLKTQTAALAREQPFSQEKLLQAQSRLYDLRIFDWASVGPKKPIADQKDEEALVKVHETKRTDIIYGFGFEISHRGGNVPAGTIAVPGLPPINIGNRRIAPSQATYASPRGSLEIIRRNLRGLGETASVSLLGSRLDQRVLASYSIPNLRRSRWSALTALSYERTSENPLFAAQLEDASFQLERLIHRKTDTRFQLRYDYNHTSLSQLLVPELVEPRDRNVYLSSVSGTFIRDTRDHPLDAHHGSFETLNLSITPSAFGSSANFVRLFGQYSFYQPVHGMVWANSFRLGFDKAFSGSFVPTSQLFFAGGGTTLRGFPIDEAGPQRLVPFCNVLVGTTGCVKVTVPVGGRQLFILNSELRFPLKLWSLGGVVFYDGGNVYSAINFNQLVNNYSNTIGIGLRYATPVGPIRLDLGRNLNPVPGIGATQYFITLGQAF